ncbi:N-acetylmuramoyl-L-alanine amidase [Steroidobacter sp. S1-65]|uniref:N-acetylmuramoyl-L-alanine amidase n=1 Tax=Steroidobacter gossypii TaxID=2805490 RepID=A0ABS1X4V5_9GAMM|nr:peptidoglycan recognition family protein [Steroidobacter gossypii]MBM0108260.1 N-acetylmuramoyl-L-alanine amidase [Steroidobacter gossypii]
MTAAASGSPTERYRRERPPVSRECGEELTRITDDIDDPVVKLRYLQGALNKEGDKSALVQFVPIPPARRAWYRLKGLLALDGVADEAVANRTLAARKTARRVVVGTTAAALLFVPVLVAIIAWQVNKWSSDAPEPMASTVGSSTEANATAIESATAPLAVQPTLTAAPVEADVTVNQAPVAEPLEAEDLGIVPSMLWLADRGPDWELYSNGLRIETAYTVKGAPRNYRVHSRAGQLLPTRHSRPIGILFHTSESDLWPLEPDYEKELRRGSEALLRFVRREQAYNYLIDRFGRVYRVVDDESRANHAGHGVWSRGGEVYLDLNSAFLGVSFESRWEGGRTLPITRAQLIAGRNLTHYLRQRFSIAPEMCVTHGLVSVSPKRGLIGYHLDWARGFPFEAFGLPDLYSQTLPSVSLFGFNYDSEFLRTMGERWPGLIAAERQLADEARERAMSLDDLRRERQAQYRRWRAAIPTPTSAEPELETPAPQTADRRG